MNREERRNMIRTIPGYRKILAETASKAVSDLEESFKKRWEEDDDSLNYGQKDYIEDNDEDLNC